MGRTLSMNEPILHLVERYPEVKDIMMELGFRDIAIPGMLQTAGRYMTLNKGMKLKKMDVDTVRQAFAMQGFALEE
ncbi:DUF1858 domain-containing protein [Paenibacillus massiliensis]|uniref:DUF1858 domain-containing protein n=1 Tax=Paenibacillus massiliensis TaxID=225917 RepID=UPI000362194C|nr:DUF1858 domain-containing protein [Paenibacillus massiliensis]